MCPCFPPCWKLRNTQVKTGKAHERDAQGLICTWAEGPKGDLTFPYLPQTCYPCGMLGTLSQARSSGCMPFAPGWGMRTWHSLSLGANRPASAVLWLVNPLAMEECIGTPGHSPGDYSCCRSTWDVSGSLNTLMQIYCNICYIQKILARLRSAFGFPYYRICLGK